MFNVIHGLTRRRVLINYRVDPVVMRPLVPEEFELALEDGWALAGICLIHQQGMRPSWMPIDHGLSTQSAAYRVAVNGPDGSAVYVGRRDTDSRLQAAAAGWLFPGLFERSTITAHDDGTRLDVAVTTVDGLGDLRLAARAAATLPNSSIFPELKAASTFFEGGAIGWSPRRQSDRLDGVELRSREWILGPLDVELVESSYYDDPSRFPPGSIEFDCALVMRDVRHEWRTVRPRQLVGSAPR